MNPSQPKDRESLTSIKQNNGNSLDRKTANEDAFASARSGGYGYGYGEDDSRDGIPLRNYWRSVRKRLWLVISISLLVTMLSAVYVARQPDIFEAQARIQVDLESSPPAMGASKSAPIVVNSTLSDVSYFNTQLENLSSSGLLRRVVKTLDLEHNPEFLKSKPDQTRWWRNLTRIFGFNKNEKVEVSKETLASQVAPPVAAASSREDLEEAMRLEPYVAAIQENLTVKQVSATRLIKLTYHHHDPLITAKVVNALMDACVLSNLEMKTQTNTSTGDFLQRRIAELQDKIRSGEEQLINYAKNNQILTLDENQNTVVERLVGLNRQLLEAENTRKLAESAYRAAQVPGAAGAKAEVEGKQIGDLETRLGELRQKRAELLVDNTEEWPAVKEIDKQIEAAQSQMDSARKRTTSVVITNLKTTYDQALAHEQSLKSSFNQQRGETVTQNQAAINYRIIQQEITTNKTLLDGLLQRSKENDVDLAGTPNNIHVNEHAIIPRAPVGPRRLLTIILALVASTIAGVFLALFLEYLDDSVRSTEDVERLLRLPTLAVIPAMGISARRRLRPAAGTLVARNGNGNGNGNPELLLSNTNKHSPLAEAYRQLRTSVLLSTAGRAPRTVLVTSSVPAEGKTTGTINTAISMAQTAPSVLIIDGDMRRPRVHSVFGLENRRGLSTILSSEPTEAEMLSMIEQDSDSGLHLLTAGPIPPNPAELISSDQMRRLLATVSSSFTHVVIDSPPITSFTDGVLLATMVDGVLLVVHSGKSSRNVVRRSRQLLTEVGAKIFGVVLNRVDSHSPDYYYYKNQYYGYEYTGNEDEEHVASPKSA
jgi:capsular exopolysaccharide synthesis family protein